MSNVKDRCPSCETKPQRLGGDLEYFGGPDHITVVECRNCGWWNSYDPAADESPRDDLRATTEK